MDIQIDFNTPALYDDPAYDTDNLDTSSSSCSSSSSSSSTTPSSSGTSSSVTSSSDNPTSCSPSQKPQPKIRRITPSTYPESHLKKPQQKLTIRIPTQMPEPRIQRLVPSSFPVSHLKKPEQKVTIRTPENYPPITPPTSDPQPIPQPEPATQPFPESQKSDEYLFTVLTINTWLLSTWTIYPADKYLHHLNIAVLRDAPVFIWNLPAGLRLRDSIEEGRREFIKSLYICTNSSQTSSAAELFIRRIDDWTTALETYARRFPSITTRQRKASAMMVRHRARNLTYRAVLGRFGAEPTMENLVAAGVGERDIALSRGVQASFGASAESHSGDREGSVIS
ncbi:hypothetical protein ACHWQZ_G013028 [Mnemiopsis leidyi]